MANVQISRWLRWDAGTDRFLVCGRELELVGFRGLCGLARHVNGTLLVLCHGNRRIEDVELLREVADLDSLDARDVG